MLTSCYAVWSKNFIPGGVSISRSQGSYSYPVYTPLAPGSWCFKTGVVDYLSRYQAQLDKLNAKAVWAELQAVATDDAIRRFGLDPAKASMVEPVIMCWEKPGGTSAAFCHRRLAAQWLQTELGMTVPEGYVDRKGERRLTANFDTLCRIEEDGSFVRLGKETNPGQGALKLF
jgi:hypothetical protein